MEGEKGLGDSGKQTGKTENKTGTPQMAGTDGEKGGSKINKSFYTNKKIYTTVIANSFIATNLPRNQENLLTAYLRMLLHTSFYLEFAKVGKYMTPNQKHTEEACPNENEKQ